MGLVRVVLEAPSLVRNVIYLVFVLLVIAVGAHFAFQEARAGQASFLFTIGAPTVAVALLGIWRAQHDGVLKDWFLIRSGDFTRGFLAAAALFVAAWAFTRFVTPSGSPREFWLARLYLQFGDPTYRRAHVVAIGTAMVILAVAEEVVWRGLVTSLLAELLGSRRAWVWAAVLYGLAHAATIRTLADPIAGYNPILPLAAVAAGLLWGFLARRYERLWPSILSHILFDWAVLMMFPLWGSGL